jgi:RNA polymerase sigma-70 factor (ECF subfamily)
MYVDAHPLLRIRAHEPRDGGREAVLFAGIARGARRLPDVVEREAIVLRDIQELTYEEIAEITNTAMGTVKSRINRSRLF